MIPSNTVTYLFNRHQTTEYTLNKITSTDFVDVNYPSKGPGKVSTPYQLYAFPVFLKGGKRVFEVIEDGSITLWVNPAELSVIPTTEDTITHTTDGTYSIKRIRRYQDQGVTYLYAFQLRQ